MLNIFYIFALNVQICKSAKREKVKALRKPTMGWKISAILGIR